MAHPMCSDEEFIRLFKTRGPAETARTLNCTERAVYKRRKTLARFEQINPPGTDAIDHPGRIELEIKNGEVLIGSDFHIWPGKQSTCLRAFKKFCADIKPDAVILNGDVLDLPRVSRHPQSWATVPDPQQEIEAAQDHLNDLVQACKRSTHKIWTQGNHDIRFDQFLANAAPQLRGVKGVRLSDHFSAWSNSMSCFINESVDGGATMVKHRLKGGMNATRANTLNAGVSVVTGHLHCQNVRPISDYRSHDRYGVDTGCVADKEHQAFTYAEDAPLDWRSGFALLTYRAGRLMYPELITKWDETHVQWRGELVKV